MKVQLQLMILGLMETAKLHCESFREYSQYA